MTLHAWTLWDRRALLRAFAAAGLAWVLVWLVTAATDEGQIAWAVRAGRALPLAPVCAGIGAWTALARGRARGEMLALESLGRSPWQNAMGAVLGGSAVAIVAAIAIAAAPRVDIAGFFPTIAHEGGWERDARGFVDPEAGLRVDPSGELAIVAKSPRAAAVLAAEPLHGRASAALATALAGIALPLVAVRLKRRALVRSTLELSASGVAAILCFQLAAARAVPAIVVALPALFLLGLAVFRYRSRDG